MNAFGIGRRLLLRMGLLRHSRSVMEELSRQCNEAVYLAIRRGSEFLFIDVVESAQQVKVASLVGKRFPLANAAPGQVIHAYSDPAGVQLNDSSSMPGIRLKGYCYDQEGLGEMVGCLAAPFFVVEGFFCGFIRRDSISISDFFPPDITSGGWNCHRRSGFSWTIDFNLPNANSH